MGAPTTEEMKDKFLKTIPDRGISNPRLREELGWTEENYVRIRDILVEEGKVERGRGPGGTVYRVDPRVLGGIIAFKQRTFLGHLKRLQEERGGRVAHARLRELLGWSENDYNDVFERLLQRGKIGKGGGPGGTVYVLEEAVEEAEPIDASDAPRPRNVSTPENDERALLSLLQDHAEGHSRSALQESLGWDDDQYTEVRIRLLNQGLVRHRMGRGGGLALIVPAAAMAASAVIEPTPAPVQPTPTPIQPTPAVASPGPPTPIQPTPAVASPPASVVQRPAEPASPVPAPAPAQAQTAFTATGGTNRTDTHAYRELRDAYADGTVVAFVGAGASLPAGLPTWKTLLERLLEHARDEEFITPAADAEIVDYIKHGHFIDAMSALKYPMGTVEFSSFIRRELGDRDLEPSPLNHALAQLTGRLRAVLTTNIDRLLERAFPQSWNTVVRPSGDLAQQRNMIVKLHGTLDEPNTWIFTREQYEDAYYNHPHYRSYFSTMLHAHHMMFVGYGLDDGDFNQLLAAIRATSRNQPPRHFAFIEASTIRPDRRRKLQDAGIRVISYRAQGRDHGELVQLVRGLAEPR